MCFELPAIVYSFRWRCGCYELPPVGNVFDHNLESLLHSHHYAQPNKALLEGNAKVLFVT
jgi:hypothetical protein